MSLRFSLASISNVALSPPGFIAVLAVLAFAGKQAAYIYVSLSLVYSFVLLLSARRVSGDEEAVIAARYISFVVALWLFTPFVRRLGDFSSSWSDVNIYGLSPLFCTAISIFFVRLNSVTKKALFPFLLMLVSVLYGYIVGLFTSGVVPATFALFNWACPLLFFMYVASRYTGYSALMREVRVSLSFYSVIVGSYGIYQYFLLPGWDAYWIENAKMTSVGAPFPMAVRVFSTMNSPMVLAPVLVMMVIFMTAKTSATSILGIVSSVGAILLSFVRAAWGGLAIGGVLIFFVRVIRQPVSSVKYFILSTFLLALVVVGVLGSPAGERLVLRLESLDSLQSDTSFNERQRFYSETVEYVSKNIIGDGMGSTGVAKGLADNSLKEDTVFDSGLLLLPITLGWFGAVVYCVGLAVVVFMAWSNLRNSRDEYRYVLFSIALSSIVQMIFSNRLSGPVGFFFFFFLGLSVCSYLSRKSRLASAMR